MANITVRNIPDRALERLRELASADRRSINSEILVLLERAIELEQRVAPERPADLAPAVQIKHWEALCGRWSDDRRWEEIAADIVHHRTPGREVGL